MRYSVTGIAAIALLCAAGCAQKRNGIDATKLAMFSPLPDKVPAKPGGPLEERVALGRMLFYDARLSRNQQISCNSCHDLSRYGVDGEATSLGHKGQRGDRNSPTVYNAAAQFVQFWDGRAEDVEAQAKGPVLNPVEMAMPSDRHVVAVLRSIPEYVAAFGRAYPDAPDPVTCDNLADAIGAFERGLMTPSRWDKFLEGDQTALTAEEQDGFKIFVNTGCPTCHAGALLGGSLYQKIGVFKDYPDTSDPGRFQVTRNDVDRMIFKVPSLRNVEKTAPYFHNGKIATLDQAVARMAEYQLGKQLSAGEVSSIVTFLKTLTGELPADYIHRPDLPKSTVKTPKPQEAD